MITSDSYGPTHKDKPLLEEKQVAPAEVPSSAEYGMMNHKESIAKSSSEHSSFYHMNMIPRHDKNNPLTYPKGSIASSQFNQSQSALAHHSNSIPTHDTPTSPPLLANQKHNLINQSNTALKGNNKTLLSHEISTIYSVARPTQFKLTTMGVIPC